MAEGPEDGAMSRRGRFSQRTPENAPGVTPRAGPRGRSRLRRRPAPRALIHGPVGGVRSV